ncbi:type II secretion system protein [Luteolibacter marinus]|uniref:type II secretion system protein n=1 Tax=Luteolibacter marinus TaxID=2776705 RepID=UPI0018671004|nr:hypothetical protein [Luteolibacter marinus]
MKIDRTTAVRRGFTLLELALGMAVGITVATLLLSLVNQQIAFLRIFNAQNFLTTEAPMINNYLVKIVGTADGYRLYESVDDIVSGNPPVMADAPVLMLRFKEPDGTFRASVLSFEDPGTGTGLYYRMVNSSGELGTPDWSLTKRPDDVRFSIEQGILRIRLIGPNGEELTYSGSQQL